MAPARHDNTRGITGDTGGDQARQQAGPAMRRQRPLDARSASRPDPTALEDTVGKVRLGEKVVATASLREHPERYVTWFSRARSEVGYATCLCRPGSELQLVIRLRNGRYHLATWPECGPLHAPGCSWHRDLNSASGRSAYRDAIIHTDTGTSIRLSTPLTVRGATAGPDDRAAVPTANAATSPTSRRALGPLALLHFLWEQAGLNTWSPETGRRSWSHCRERLLDQANDIRVNQRDLDEALWIVPEFRREMAEQIHGDWEFFLTRLASFGRDRRRGLVLGELRSIAPADYSTRVQLAHQRAPLFASEKLVAKVQRSYPSVFSAQSGQADRRQVLLCLIERSRHGYPMIVELAAMLTTKSFVPADSGFEVLMANALADAGRAFIKPLRYDGESAVFPDFVLLDDQPPTVVEVWGVTGREAYEQRKRAKLQHYRETGSRLIEWDVRDPLPNLSRPGLCTPPVITGHDEPMTAPLRL